MKKIFLLDDNEEFLDITTLILGKEYIIESSVNTDFLAEKIEKFNPDLILIDHFIGHKKSNEIMEGIKKGNPKFKIPIILCSGSPDIEEKAATLGAIGFIEKPSSLAYIRSYIQGFFNRNTSLS